MNILAIADPPLITHSCAVVMSQLAKQWVKLGHRVTYLGYNYTGEKINHPDGYEIIPDTFPPTRETSVKLAIDYSKADIVVAHGSKDVFSEGMRAAEKAGIPYLPSTFYSTPTKNDKINTFEARNGFILYDCANVDDMVVCNNFSVGVGFALGKRTWFIPNGVDTEIFFPHKEGEASDNYKQELGIPYNAFVFLFSGSNISGKDPGRCIDAFAKFRESNCVEKENTYLVMHTRPENSHLNLRKIAEERGVLKFVKFFLKHSPNQTGYNVPPDKCK